MSKRYSCFFTVVFNGVEAENQEEAAMKADKMLDAWLQGFGVEDATEPTFPDHIDQDEPEEE